MLWVDFEQNGLPLDSPPDDFRLDDFRLNDSQPLDFPPCPMRAPASVKWPERGRRLQQPWRLLLRVP